MIFKIMNFEKFSQKMNTAIACAAGGTVFGGLFSSMTIGIGIVIACGIFGFCCK
jgi:hypothetical protein